MRIWWIALSPIFDLALKISENGITLLTSTGRCVIMMEKIILYWKRKYLLIFRLLLFTPGYS